MKRLLVAGGAAMLLAACSPAPAALQVVHVRIEHSAFEPAELSLPAGTTIRFVVHNRDPIDHEFILGNDAVQRRHEDGTERHHGAKPGEVSIPALQTRATTVSFDRPGALIFGCHLPGHYAYGMRGTVQVEG